MRSFYVYIIVHTAIILESRSSTILTKIGLWALNRPNLIRSCLVVIRCQVVDGVKRISVSLVLQLLVQRFIQVDVPDVEVWVGARMIALTLLPSLSSTLLQLPITWFGSRNVLYIHIVFTLKASRMSTSIWFASFNVIVLQAVRVQWWNIARLLLIDAIGPNVRHDHVLSCCNDGVFLKSSVIKDTSGIMVIIKPSAISTSDIFLQGTQAVAYLIAHFLVGIFV